MLDKFKCSSPEETNQASYNTYGKDYESGITLQKIDWRLNEFTYVFSLSRIIKLLFIVSFKYMSIYHSM